jgi:ubiquitin carboxyl-terminal hydrolase 7
MLAAEFGVPVHRQRLWTWVSRQNKTYRPDKPLQLEYADETPVMDVKDEPAPGAHYQRVQAEIRLYLEVVDETLAAPPPLHAEYVLGEPMDEGGAQYPLLRADDVFLFVKYFDAEAQAVSFVGTHLARSTDRLSDLVPVLRALKGLDASQELVVYEEVEFESTVLFNAIREDRTLRDAEVQNGDILVFQLLSDLPATDDDAAAMLVDGQPPSPASAAASGAPALTVPAFFEAFKNRVTVNLFKLPQTSEAANIREREPPIKLPMDKRMTYLDVTAAVAAAVGCESSHVRLTMHNVYTEQPKPQPIAYQGANVLLELLMATGQRVRARDRSARVRRRGGRSERGGGCGAGPGREGGCDGIAESSVVEHSSAGTRGARHHSTRANGC